VPARFGPTPQPDLDQLQSQLLTSGLQLKDQPLYQVINQLIGATKRIQSIVNTNISNATGFLAAVTFLTITDETAVLPASKPTGLTGFTAGSVLFSNGASLIEQDNANLFWDNGNNRLGIRTNVPTVSLDVVNNALAAVSTPGIRFANTTAATSGVTRQFSPTLVFSGTGWDTDNTVSRTVRVGIDLRPVSGTVVQSALFIATDENGSGTLTDNFVIGTIAVGDTPRFGIRDGNLLFRNAGRGISFVANPLSDPTDGNFLISGSVASGLNRIVFNAVPGFVFIEANNFSATAGTVPSMDFRNFDASTSTPIIGIRHRATPGGTVAVGFGTRQLYQASSSTTANQDQGAFDIIWSDVTHATRTGAFSVSLVNSAAALAEKLRLHGRGLLDVTAGYINWVGQKRVTTQFDKTNSAALATVTGLSVNVEAGRSYYFEAHLYVDADITGGHQYAIGGSATATNIKYQIDSIDNTLNVFIITARQVALGGAAGQAGATIIETIIKGQIVVNAAGTLVVQFAQNVATPATTSSVLTNSTFIVQEIA